MLPAIGQSRRCFHHCFVLESADLQNQICTLVFRAALFLYNSILNWPFHCVTAILRSLEPRVQRPLERGITGDSESRPKTARSFLDALLQLPKASAQESATMHCENMGQPFLEHAHTIGLSATSRTRGFGMWKAFLANSSNFFTLSRSLDVVERMLSSNTGRRSSGDRIGDTSCRPWFHK